SVYGAVEKVIQWPAPLNVPWNLDLSRRNERTPVHLRLRVSGNGKGAVGLVRPTLTVPSSEIDPPLPEAGPDEPPPATLVLVAVRGLRMMDLVDSPTPQLPGLHSNTWATGTTLRSSLTSLLTGTYTHTHGFVGLKDPLPTGLPLLGFTMRDTGRKTFLRAGYLPLPQDSPLWGGFDDVAFADPPERPPNAEAVLSDALLALEGAGDGPTFAMVILDDIRRPYAARGDHWKKHWPPDAKTPWVPAQSRQAFRALDSGKMKPTTQIRAFERTLRSGKVDEVLEALDRFRRNLREKLGPNTRLMIVGMGDTGIELFGSRDPRALNVPLWVDPPLKGRHHFMEAADLTDVPATLMALAETPMPEAYQGRALTQWHPGAWWGSALASRERRADLIATRDFVVTHIRDPKASYKLWKRQGANWVNVAEPSKGEEVWLRLLGQQLDGWRGAGSRWRTGTYEPTVTPDGHPGTAQRCR
ncbi:MAG: hypothetical protein VX938_06790, partial [Myxococcota bacterium]|nr:hypothetical protein [Myxococcota bacterium]